MLYGKFPIMPIGRVLMDEGRHDRSKSKKYYSIIFPLNSVKFFFRNEMDSLSISTTYVSKPLSCKRYLVSTPVPGPTSIIVLYFSFAESEQTIFFAMFSSL